ncbi:hypothetical protein AAFF_G00241210 [Aldrovandia affinis]|uniref:Uncharacterized protein n=1 Tax=Aldrovandia affinis TaxID=143900 RepID=A0AAD7SUU9_9TELE|nr:hypothetical protein AAFF_G00241210 [Aldrovandia affinis]
MLLPLLHQNEAETRHSHSKCGPRDHQMLCKFEYCMLAPVPAVERSTLLPPAIITRIRGWIGRTVKLLRCGRYLSFECCASNSPCAMECTRQPPPAKNCDN